MNGRQNRPSFHRDREQRAKHANQHRQQGQLRQQRKGKWIETDKTFVNPYNFVSLGDGCRRFDIAEYNRRDDLLTGVIECKLETKTPIFIPNPTSQNVLNHPDSLKTLDFYSYKVLDGRDREPAIPVIPASEIRGVIRAAFEAVTDSCMSTVDVDRKLYRRTMVLGKPGILRKDEHGYYIQEAIRIPVNKDGESREWSEGQIVYVKNVGKRKIIQTHPFPGAKPGYFHRGEFFDRKKNESIFIEKNDEGKKIHLPNNFDPIDYIKKLLWLYDKENKINQTEEHTGYKDYKNYLDQDGIEHILIYYKKYSNQFYLSPACISKELFYKKLDEILENQGGYQPCTSRQNVCPSCAIFGMVGKQDRLASRLRFTDAHVSTPKNNPSEFYLPFKVLDELSSPKLSATEFYLENPGTDIWNYDYAGNWEEKRLVLQEDYQPKIRGRKFYWHSKSEPKWQDYQGENDKNLHKRNCAIRPLKEGIQFTFRIYFEQISEEDLKRLIWTLNIGGNESSHCHKIGMGKPLGLGSIKIKVNQVKIRKIQLKTDTILHEEVPIEYSLDEIDKVVDLNAKYVKEFLRITDMEEAKMNISYPKAKDESDSKHPEARYHWFLGNRSIHATSTRQKVHRSLPHLSEEDVELKVYFKK